MNKLSNLNKFLILNEITRHYPTPFYVYSQEIINEKLTNLKDHSQGIDLLVCYAIKANSNLHILKIIKNFGYGADAVSIGEIKRALFVGIDPQKIVFSGVGKTKEDIEFALTNNIFQINVESFSELFLINDIAKKMNIVANIALRLNPNIDANTHHKISTGRKHDKFGVSEESILNNIEQIKNLNNINFRAISVHIGSQISDIEPYKKTMLIVKKLYNKLINLGIKIEVIDLGGGFAVDYNNKNYNFPMHEYFALIKELFLEYKIKFIIEPGRYIIANSAILLSKIIHIKEEDNINFAIIDAGMNDFIRTAIYDHEHRIENATSEDKNQKLYDIVGPICESSDYFARNIKLPVCKQDDYIIIFDCGAYGSSMSSNYNSRVYCPEFLLDNGKYKLIKRQQLFDEMIMFETGDL